MGIPVEKVIEPELSYQIVGIAFSVFNKLGPGLAEKDYQQGFLSELQNSQILFEKEKILLLGNQATYDIKRFADFLVANRIIVELKVVHKLGYAHVKQVLSYLRAAGLKLGILIYFTNDGVKYRRILNPDV